MKTVKVKKNVLNILYPMQNKERLYRNSSFQTFQQVNHQTKPQLYRCLVLEKHQLPVLSPAQHSMLILQNTITHINWVIRSFSGTIIYMFVIHSHIIPNTIVQQNVHTGKLSINEWPTTFGFKSYNMQTELIPSNTPWACNCSKLSCDNKTHVLGLLLQLNWFHNNNVY